MLLQKYITVLLLMLLSITVFAQENRKEVDSLTRGQVLEMSIEELSLYDLEELTKLMDIVGASSLDELYELLLNKDVTSASKSAESVFDSPLSTTVLSHDQILASGATSIEEALRLVPGVIVREKTNGTYDVHIRGNDNIPTKNMLLYAENSNTLAMINGRPVFNYSHGGTLWETLPISFDDIDRIEVVRGPSSALYGPNAVSGVINIITQKVNDDTPLISGNLQAGSMSTYMGDIAIRQQVNEKLSIGITANYETRDRERSELYMYNGGDTPSEYSYSLDGNAVGNGYYTRDEARRLAILGNADGSPLLNPQGKPYELFPDKGETIFTLYGIDKIFETPDKSKERLGLNGYIDFTPADKINISLSGGYQNSYTLTSSMADMPTPYAGKESSTGYVNLQADVKGLVFQANYNSGATDFMTGNEGYKLDVDKVNVQAEYNFDLNKLNIRPGLSYQSISYNDQEYISQDGRGYLNGERTVNIAAASLRADYKPTEKLRLIAALRTEKYNNPNDYYSSYQFIASYKINENNLVRAVYSKANQSPFVVNAYSNYTWNIVNRPYPRKIQLDGNKDYDLKTMDMIEIGYRVRPSKNVLIDFEGFYTKSKDFGALTPDYTNYAIYNPLQAIMGQPALARPDSVHMQYLNYDVKAKQLGASVSIDWVISEKLVANAHLTVQKTELDNYLGLSRDDLIGLQATEAGMMAQGSLIAIGTQLGAGQISPADVPSIIIGSSTTIPKTYTDGVEHKSTPSYFGGFALTYRPIKKLEFFPQIYYYGEQTFVNQYATVDIDSKIILNAKVSYKATEKLTLYLNGKNLLGQDSAEFAFLDKTPMMILGGIHFKF